MKDKLRESEEPKRQQGVPPSGEKGWDTLFGVQMAIQIDKDRVRGKGVLGAPWHSVWQGQTSSIPATLPCEAPGDH